jgi:hypothetical protein
MATELGTVNVVQKWGRSLDKKYCSYVKKTTTMAIRQSYVGQV